MTVIIRTSVRHNRHANGNFIYIQPATGEPRCGYAVGYAYNERPSLHSKVALYSTLDANCPVIVGYITHIISHTPDSVSVLITPCLQFYSKEFHPEPYHLRIPAKWITLSPLQVVSRRLYLAFHPSHHTDSFQDPTPCYFSYISVCVAECTSADLSSSKHFRLPYHPFSSSKRLPSRPLLP